jgi:glycosyltransferase involved in cell wall biosynthesis
MLKLAMVTAFPDDPGAPKGGVEAVSVTLARALAALPGLEVHVVTTGDQEARRSTWGAVTIHRLPRAGNRVLTEATGPGRRQIQEYLTRLAPDVVHAHDVYGLMLKGFPAPRVFTIHGFIHGDTLVSGERWARLRSHIWRRVEVAGWADQPHIVSISPYVRERLTGIVQGVIHDIDNPIDELFFDIVRTPSARPTIFSAALISPRKNTLALVDAFGHLVASGIDAELRLAGHAPEPAYERRVLDRIQALGLGDRVRILGRVTTRDVARELSTATVFALVSLEENSPMGIEEAMAAGVPVLTSNRCGMPYMVRDGRSGFLVDPHDPLDIADRLTTLLTDRDLQARMGNCSQAIARDRFHPAVVAARTHDVYLRAVRGRESTAA